MRTFFAVFFGILAGVAVIGGIIWVIGRVKEIKQAAALESEMPAQHLKSISIACDTYRAKFGRFPNELADLGYKDGKIEGNILEDPRHAGLLDPMLTSGKNGGYVLTYKVDNTDRQGYATAYSVTASPDHGDGKRFFVDQTGIVRFTAEKRPATATDLPDSTIER